MEMRIDINGKKHTMGQWIYRVEEMFAQALKRFNDVDDEKEAIGNLIGALEKRIAKLEASLRCSRCGGSGTITMRDGDLDECPDCMGSGIKV